MKKLNFILLTFILAFLSVIILSQDNSKSYFILDTDKSYLRWEGKKITGSHFGMIQFDSSFVEMTHGKISSGEFALDMTSITCEDIQDSTLNQQLVNHLKRDDFFGVEKYPSTHLNIKICIPNPTAKKGQPNYTFIADLTIKDSTHTITFPAELSLNDKGMTGTAEFDFDRTKYGIHFNSFKYFPDIADKMIDDMVNIKGKLFFIRSNELNKMKEEELKNKEE